MDIDLVNDLRRHDDDDDDESDENDEKLKKDDSENEESKKTDVESVMKKANEVAKKKVARRPRPKLDVDRLTGPRGLDELCSLFKNEKFKGKGYEFVDLDTLMHKFEYWAHRLVPHMAFDDFIEKAENLGSKKPVKNALQCLRDKLNIQTLPDDDTQAGHTLLDLLPSIDPENDNNTNNDIPDDNELNELFQ
ncbi:unnamed protein product [Rotaria sordida]|uniref:TIMELESS-interacting protein n=1 Tax=Rotaria sordida TaxID=392033 RepID=A0A815S833_9BILA|nr:unnamed protein product [Rotaria sordida]CAF1486233.1 unnamed protein product [Rotaria sordida]CAF1649956.1 unnamed protein product [Rotaria sordida]CAF3552260.1 unnamed protein product [Rotaria sordida]